ncbi:LysR family transcriptional regulator [Xylophilus sp.]|uniref:LysR family transcriptional regulator n=1 Tax=Xylophilus sp. TaxID=2653893 RepID=UPI0013B97110|nr:LysR family transcriptional regulator [Xylophilus sp.]KAF1050085.1 MAG: HTH-type transcriptional regulator PgrR [Xylophilus sp.]
MLFPPAEPPATATPAPQDLRIFLRVADLASFTAAAQQLGLPRATVSTAVQRLENRVGARLLQRTTRRVVLTPDGEAFAQRSREVLADLDELGALFQAQPAQIAGRLRVDMPLATARELVLPRLPAFLDRYPGLTVELGSTDRRVDPVREGYDAVVRVGPLATEHLVARRIARYEMVNLVSAGYVRRHGMPRTLDDLAGHRLVHYQPNLGERAVGVEYRDPATGETRFAEMAGSVTVNNSDAYMAACHAGLGIVQVPLSAPARAALASGELVALLDALRPAPMPVTVLYPHHRHLPRRVRVFIDWIAEIFR